MKIPKGNVELRNYIRMSLQFYPRMVIEISGM